MRALALGLVAFAVLAVGPTPAAAQGSLVVYCSVLVDWAEVGR